MSWIFGYLGKQAAEAPDLRAHLYSFDLPGMKVRAGGSGRNLLCFPNLLRNAETVFILGDPILRHDYDFSYPQTSDWQWLLADERRLGNLDGHWLIVIASQTGIMAYNDSLGKRSLFVHQGPNGYFFCSEISLLKDAGLAELDAQRFGAYWHSQFPPNLRRYAPCAHSYYQNVEMLFQGGKLVLNEAGLKLENKAFTPNAEAQDLTMLLQNLTLLPLRAGKKVCVGISGGMDIRPLLAILIASGMDFSTVHFGSNKGEDYRISESIAAAHKVPFRFIDYREVSSWAMANEYLYTRGFGFNPASNCLMGYHPIIAREADVFLNGSCGELFRFRLMTAHLSNCLKPGTLDYHAFANYLYMKPFSFFIPEINKALHQGFMSALQTAVAQMPDPRSMAKPLWMNLFYIRYCLRSIDMPDLVNLDQYLCDYMPFLQNAVVQQHWQYGLWAQLDEQLHRRIIRSQAPELERYPLAIAEHSAPYYYRSFALKLRLVIKRGKSKVFTDTRTQDFLQGHKCEILDLRRDRRVVQDAWLDLHKIDQVLDKYYSGDASAQNAVLSFVTYVLAK